MGQHVWSRTQHCLFVSINSNQFCVIKIRLKIWRQFNKFGPSSINLKFMAYHHNVRLVQQVLPCRRCLPVQSFCWVVFETLIRLWLRKFSANNNYKLGSLQKSTAISLSFLSFSRKVSAYFSLKPPLCAFEPEMELISIEKMGASNILMEFSCVLNDIFALFIFISLITIFQIIVNGFNVVRP